MASLLQQCQTDLSQGVQQLEISVGHSWLCPGRSYPVV